MLLPRPRRSRRALAGGHQGQPKIRHNQCSTSSTLAAVAVTASIDSGAGCAAPTMMTFAQLQCLDAPKRRGNAESIAARIRRPLQCRCHP